MHLSLPDHIYSHGLYGYYYRLLHRSSSTIRLRDSRQRSLDLITPCRVADYLGGPKSTYYLPVAEQLTQRNNILNILRGICLDHACYVGFI